jgi:hypothetical protein
VEAKFLKRWLYDLMYRFVPVEWVFGPSSQLENFVDLAILNDFEP